MVYKKAVKLHQRLRIIDTGDSCYYLYITDMELEALRVLFKFVQGLKIIRITTKDTARCNRTYKLLPEHQANEARKSKQLGNNNVPVRNDAQVEEVTFCLWRYLSGSNNREGAIK